MNDLEKEFIPYQEAFELKELGFDEPCMASRDMNNKEGIIQIPLYQQAFRWFRKKGYRFSVIIDSPLAEEESHYIEVWFEKQFLHESHYIYKTYEDGELGLLKKLIQYEKEKQQ
jgi:hypothetical protein